MSSRSRSFAYDEMVPGGAYIRTPHGWITVSEHRRRIDASEVEQPAIIVEDPEPMNALAPPIWANWNRSQRGGWRAEVNDVIVSIGSKATHECKSYRTAGEIIQMLKLEVAVLQKSKFLYVVRLLQFIFPRALSDRGQFVSGTTQRELFAILDAACSMIHFLDGSYLHNLHKTMKIAESSTLSCSEGDSKLRRRLLDQCKSKLAFECQHRPDCLTLDLLPEDVLKMIAATLNPDDLASLSQVSSVLHHVCSDPWLWRSHCLRYFPSLFIHVDSVQAPWKKLFEDAVSRFGPVWLGIQDTLTICTHCQLLFWASTVHACGEKRVISPQQFLDYFVV